MVLLSLVSRLLKGRRHAIYTLDVTLGDHKLRLLLMGLASLFAWNFKRCNLLADIWSDHGLLIDGLGNLLQPCVDVLLGSHFVNVEALGVDVRCILRNGLDLRLGHIVRTKAV